MSSLLVSRKEKEKQVLKLATDGKTMREIAKAIHVSLKDIGNIIRKATGDDDDEGLAEKEDNDKQNRLKALSPYARAFQMFKDRKSQADVAIELDKNTDTILNFYSDYLRLTGRDGIVTVYSEIKNDFPLFFHLYHRIKKEGLNKKDIIELSQNQQKLTYLEKRVVFYNDHIQGQQAQVHQLCFVA